MTDRAWQLEVEPIRVGDRVAAHISDTVVWWGLVAAADGERYVIVCEETGARVTVRRGAVSYAPTAEQIRERAAAVRARSTRRVLFVASDGRVLVDRVTAKRVRNLRRFFWSVAEIARREGLEQSAVELLVAGRLCVSDERPPSAGRESQPNSRSGAR